MHGTNVFEDAGIDDSDGESRPRSTGGMAASALPAPEAEAAATAGKPRDWSFSGKSGNVPCSSCLAVMRLNTAP